MSSKNRGFAADLAGLLDADASHSAEPRPPSRLALGSLTGRTNRLAELASGSVVSRTQELVDPERCRMWAEHNRDYALLDEERCGDLIESFKAQGRQEIPAVVRRVRGDPDVDFEVICGARRHWAVTWLRQHNYADFRFLIDIRELTDEEAFRFADLENRAREDLSDLERARDYLAALDRHYEGRQKVMAQRLNVTESWLSRYLDLARLPNELMIAFPKPHGLSIKHITLLKPLLKPEESRRRVFDAARMMAAGREGQGGHDDVPVPDIIRQLAAASVVPPTRSGSPKKSGKSEPETFLTDEGHSVARIDRRSKKEVVVTFFPQGGATAEAAEAALKVLIARCWK